MKKALKSSMLKVFPFYFSVVLQNKPRNVVLCLMEVSRLATRFGIEPPGLVKFEREIAEEEEQEGELEAVKNRDGEQESLADSAIRRNSGSPWLIRETSRLPVKQRKNSGLVGVLSLIHI